MNTHEEDDHPWLREENLLLQRCSTAGVPMLGICLGGQLIAKAVHAQVTPAPVPEIGFHPVWLTPDAASDPLFAGLPERLMALQWHYYRFDLPAGAVRLAENAGLPAGLPAGRARLGPASSMRRRRARTGCAGSPSGRRFPDADRTGFEPDELSAEIDLYMDTWNELGRELADALPRGRRALRPTRAVVGAA